MNMLSVYERNLGLHLFFCFGLNSILHDQLVHVNRLFLTCRGEVRCPATICHW